MLPFKRLLQPADTEQAGSAGMGASCLRSLLRNTCFNVWGKWGAGTVFQFLLRSYMSPLLLLYFSYTVQ